MILVSEPRNFGWPRAAGRLTALGRRAGNLIAFGALCLTLNACALEWAVDYGTPLDPALTRGWKVVKVRVAVPTELTVSDNNIIVPEADIVWHGDPPGDRRAQVQQIVADAARSATAPLRGSRRVVLDITLTQFHAVTPAAVVRAPEAVHNISFVAQISDARSGNLLTGPTVIQADLPALVGSAAVNAAEYGATQKVQVTQHIEAVIKGWLGIGPDIRGTFTSAGR